MSDNTNTTETTEQRPSELVNDTLPDAPATGTSKADEEQLLEALKDVVDPELGINVVDLGLVYGVHMDDDSAVTVDMTLTSMGCPVQDMIQSDAELAVMRVDGVNRVNVEFVWSPPWGMDKVTDAGRKQLRMFGFSV